MSDKPPLLVIAGPTGVGKTAAAVALAARLPIEVVSADSRQVYRGMDVATKEPGRAGRRHPSARGRIFRALGLVGGGSPAGEAQTRWREGDAEWDVVYVGLTLDRARLDDRLRLRAQRMVAAGLEDEVRGLLARGHAPTLPAMQGLGYREFVRVAQGRLDGEEARRLMQRDTLRYARRQWTWFAREPELQWIDCDAAEAAGGGAAAIGARLKQEGRIG